MRRDAWVACERCSDTYWVKVYIYPKPKRRPRWHGAILALLAYAVSLIAFLYRTSRHRSPRARVVATAGFLVLILLFGGISNAVFRRAEPTSRGGPLRASHLANGLTGPLADYGSWREQVESSVNRAHDAKYDGQGDQHPHRKD